MNSILKKFHLKKFVLVEKSIRPRVNQDSTCPKNDDATAIILFRCKIDSRLACEKCRRNSIRNPALESAISAEIDCKHHERDSYFTPRFVFVAKHENSLDMGVHYYWSDEKLIQLMTGHDASVETFEKV